MSIHFILPVVNTPNRPDPLYIVPHDAPCLFSPRDAQGNRRKLPNPLPIQIAHSPSVADVRKKGDEIRQQFPEEAFHMPPPRSWSDLHKYFDAVDLFEQGRDFCLQVLYDLNIIGHAQKATIFKWSEELATWDLANEQKLLNLPRNQDPLGILLGEDFAHLHSHEIVLLRNALDFQRDKQIKDEEERKRRLQENQFHQNLKVRAPRHLDLVVTHRVIPSSAKAVVFDVARPCHRINPQDISVAVTSRSRGYTGHEGHRAARHPQDRRYSNDIVNRVPFTFNGTHGFNNKSVVSPRRVFSEGPIYVLKSQPVSPAQGIRSDPRIVSDTMPVRGNWVAPMQSHLKEPDRSPRRFPKLIQQTATEQSQSHGSVNGDSRSSQPLSQDARMVSIRHNYQRDLSESSPHSQSVSQGYRTMPTSLFDQRISRNSPQQGQLSQTRVTSSEVVLNSRMSNQIQYRTQNPRGHRLPSSSDHRKRRVLLQQPKVTFSDNGACTYHYLEDPNIPTADYDAIQTIFVKGFNQSFFESHKLKELMGPEVVSITCLPGSRQEPMAFIMFSEVRFANEALERYSGYELDDGRSLYVSLPLNKGSDKLQGRPWGQKYNYSQRYDMPNVPRHMSRRQYGDQGPASKQPEQYVPHSLSSRPSRSHSPARATDTAVNEGFGYQLISVRAELEQHQAGMNRIVALSKVNANMKKDVDKHNKKNHTSISMKRKENSPIKVGEDLNSNSPHKATSGSPRVQKQAARQKKNSKNTSIQQTPATTPTHLRPSVDLQLATLLAGTMQLSPPSIDVTKTIESPKGQRRDIIEDKSQRVIRSVVTKVSQSQSTPIIQGTTPTMISKSNSISRNHSPSRDTSIPSFSKLDLIESFTLRQGPSRNILPPIDSIEKKPINTSATSETCETSVTYKLNRAKKSKAMFEDPSSSVVEKLVDLEGKPIVLENRTEFPSLVSFKACVKNGINSNGLPITRQLPPSIKESLTGQTQNNQIKSAVTVPQVPGSGPKADKSMQMVVSSSKFSDRFVVLGKSSAFEDNTNKMGTRPWPFVKRFRKGK